ncbi:hypothetical protein L195_g055544, partial [Trifolium pratense]
MYWDGGSTYLDRQLYAIYKSLLLAKDINIDELVSYYDSLHCINLIKDFFAKFGVSSNVDFLTHTSPSEDVRDLLEND